MRQARASQRGAQVVPLYFIIYCLLFLLSVSFELLWFNSDSCNMIQSIGQGCATSVPEEEQGYGATFSRLLRAEATAKGMLAG